MMLMQREPQTRLHYSKSLTAGASRATLSGTMARPSYSSLKILGKDRLFDRIVLHRI
jgi:hypothetical protein